MHGPADPVGQYGATAAQRAFRPFVLTKDATFHGEAGQFADWGPPEVLLLREDIPRRKLNFWGAAQAVLLPTFFFGGSLAVLSFSGEHSHGKNLLLLLAGAGLVALALAARALLARRAGGDDGTAGSMAEEQPAETNWISFLLWTTLLAVLLGIIFGNANYSSTMRPYGSLADMSVAREVDPREGPGSRYLSDSQILFKEGAFVGEELSLGFKDTTTYCVAPIVIRNQTTGRSAPMGSYDFWAVGTDCCSPIPPAKFWCGSAAQDPRAFGGLRYMGDRYFFDLAIQQAEAEYHYTTRQPILLTMTWDPVQDVQAMQDKGIHFIVSWTAVFLLYQAALVLAAIAGMIPALKRLIGGVP